MARILIVNMGSLGDLHPFIGMGLELQRLGAEILFVSGEAYREYITSLGLPFRSVRPNLDPKDPEVLAAVMDPKDGPKRLNQDLIFRHIRVTLADTEQILTEGNFDLVVCGILAFFVPTLSELHRVPWVSATLSPIILWSAFDVPVLGQFPGLAKVLRVLGPGFTKIFHRLAMHSTRKWAAELQALRRERGLPPAPPPFGGMMHSPFLNLMLFSQHFASPQPDWPRPFAQPGFVDFDGPAKSDELDPELEQWLGRGDAPVLYTLGSTASELPGSYLDHFLESAEQHPYRSLFVVGEASAAKLRARNSDRLYFAGYVPYSRVLARARLVVHQGGIGTTAQSIKAGRPSLVVALVNDQPDNGDHLLRTGAGDWIPARGLTGGKLARKICEVAADARITTRAAALGAELRAENGAVTAAREILAYLRARGPGSR